MKMKRHPEEEKMVAWEKVNKLVAKVSTNVGRKWAPRRNWGNTLRICAPFILLITRTQKHFPNETPSESFLKPKPKERTILHVLRQKNDRGLKMCQRQGGVGIRRAGN